MPGTLSYGYHGYWASDFTTLNKHLGTEEEFKTLLDSAHAKGMKIMVDVVLNHAGYETEDYFNSKLNGKDMIRSGENLIEGDTKKGPLILSIYLYTFSSRNFYAACPSDS